MNIGDLSNVEGYQVSLQMEVGLDAQTNDGQSMEEQRWILEVA